MKRRAIFDAHILSTFVRIIRLDILTALFDEIFVPIGVLSKLEIGSKGLKIAKLTIYISTARSGSSRRFYDIKVAIKLCVIVRVVDVVLLPLLNTNTSQ